MTYGWYMKITSYGEHKAFYNDVITQSVKQNSSSIQPSFAPNPRQSI